MHDGLHVVAVALTALAVFTHPGWRRGAKPLGIGVGVLMLVAMVDAVYLAVLAVPLWSFVLLVGALALAAARSPRRKRSGTDASAFCIVTHDALGLVAMAALLPFMQGGAGQGSHHAGHGVAAGLLVAVVLAVAGGHVAASVVASVRDARSWARAQYALMGGATLLMAGAAVA